MEEAKKLYLFFKDYDDTNVEWIIYKNDGYYVVSIEGFHKSDIHELIAIIKPYYIKREYYKGFTEVSLVHNDEVYLSLNFESVYMELEKLECKNLS